MKRAAAATGVAAAAVYRLGQEPRSQLFGRIVARCPRAAGRLALTYDDGPNPRITPAQSAS